MDEASLTSMSDIVGRWPWPRAIWADLLDFLSMGGARAVLFDIVISRTDRYSKENDRTLIDATNGIAECVPQHHDTTGGP